MRFAVYTNSSGILVLLLILFMLAGCNSSSDDDPVPTEDATVESADTAQFADYMPINLVSTCRTIYIYTLGQDQGEELVRSISGIEVVPYTSGAFTGISFTDKISNTAVNTSIIVNDGITVKWLGFNEYYFSTDSILTAHPSVWSFSTLTNGMVIDQTGKYFNYNKSDPHDRLKDSNQKILVRIGDVKIYGKSYPKAVIWYYLDTAYPYHTLSFHGKNTEFGITLPTSKDTGNYSVTAYDIFGSGIGELAAGDVDAQTGELLDTYELITVSCP